MSNKQLLELDRLAKKYDENKIPLYISYPTTSWWNNEVDEEVYLNLYRDNPVNFLYVHFPYCKTSCYYCCCYREVANDISDNDIYLSYLEKEIEYKVNRIGNNAFKRIKNIHLGGGTPSYLTDKQLEDVFNIITKNIKYNRTNESHISIEAYPDKEIITIDKLKCLKSLGFTRISFGVQDFDELIQNAINRDCREKDLSELIFNAKSLGLKVNIDLCYGLPFQGINEITSTITKVIKMGPDKVSFFPYVHYPLVFPMQRFIPVSSIPNSFIRVLMMKKAIEIFEDNGFVKVGYDHFIKNNDLNKDTIRDFMGQSDINNKYFIGIGSSAISYNKNWFFHNIMTVKDYYEAINEVKLPLLRNKSFNMANDDLLRNRLILKSILTDFCIDKSKISEEFSIDFDGFFKEELSKLFIYEKDGLIEGVKLDKINLTGLGRIFARHIAHAFDKYSN